MHLLFVEDHATFAETVIAQFMTERSVVVAPSLAAALEKLAAETFDALLVDYDLPDGKGDELVRLVREKGSRVPVVAVSSHDAGNAALVAAGADVVCAKGSFATIGAVLDRLPPLPDR